MLHYLKQNAKFQFQYGSIKIKAILGTYKMHILFQFQYGSIKIG